MIDSEIVDLYLDRNELAIEKTAEKYESYCKKIALGILHNEEDVKEIINDTWMSAWNSIPPHKPVILKTFLGKITRRAAINLWRNEHTQKRSNGKITSVLEEIEECVASNKTIESEIDNKELGRIINSFLDTLPELYQNIFVCRYWYMDSIADIAQRFGFTESKVKSILHRTRKKLAKELEKEDIWI